MNSFVEILKIILPALAVFAAAYFTVRSFLNSEAKKREIELRRSSAQLVTPVRLQAYERIVIFLERLHPTNLALRTNRAGITAEQLHGELIKTIKSEYEHNISQQVYMSNTAWELVKTAKEETIKIVNLSAQKVPGSAKGSDLAQLIIQITGSVDRLPSQVALEFVKKEAAHAF